MRHSMGVCRERRTRFNSRSWVPRAASAVYYRAMQRPAPQVVKAKLAEVKRRYRWHRKHASKPQIAAIRVAELNRLFAARYGGPLPNDDTGRECLMIVAHHLMQLAGQPQQRLMNWAKERCPWLDIAGFNAVLADAAVSPKTWKADSLAWRLRLTFADRQALKIATIGAIDCSKAQRETRRRRLKKERERKRRKAKRHQAAKAVSTIIGCLIWWTRVRTIAGL